MRNFEMIRHDRRQYRTNNVYCILFLGAVLFSVAVPELDAQQLAFPTAEGSGRYATGGRGGKVYEVTNLNNSGAGSIVEAVSQSNRTIVFRVSGTIELGSVILKPKANTTIAGQTAPGDGICIKGRIQINASNIIIRYLRVRVDAGAANSSGDAIDISSGSNIMIDHVSASYARDEGISCQETSEKVTVQWSIISEALTFENHSYGSLVRGDYGDVKTYHHNLYAHNHNRLPRPGNYTMASADTLGLFFDFRNNVVYNWKGSYPGYNADTGSISRYNIIGNVYIPGQESSVTGRAFKEDAYKSYGYFADNMYNGSVPEDQWSLLTWGSKFTTDRIADYKARSYQIPMESVATTSPVQALQEVLASAGACYPRRDTIDRRIVQDVVNKTGHSIDSVSNQPEGGWPLLNGVPPPDDTDHDGMPDVWESAHSLNPNDSSDGSKVIAGNYYTNLEWYLNSLVGENVTSVISRNNVPVAFMLRQNYPNPFNPTTTIGFSLPTADVATLKVYDLLGKEVASLLNGKKNAGTYEVTLNGSHLASGVYFYKLQSGNFTAVRKFVLMK